MMISFKFGMQGAVYEDNKIICKFRENQPNGYI